MTAPARLLTALEGRYAIERELGAGGMATVYLAHDLKHEREVALKVLRPELGAVLGADRFLAEIKITARLDHPHILTLIDSGAAEGFLYYVLPYVRGESLRARIDREKQLGIDEAIRITKQIASALDYAHQRGVVHRDIKPENILLHEGEAVLADFGIALAVSEAGGGRLTETGLSLGTPQYMSPEQATGDRALDARSDVYSLAAVLYEMLAGEPPVTGPTAQAMIAKLITERPTQLRVVRDTVPENVNAAVARALAKIPADRFASAGDFARAIEQGLTQPVTRRPGKVVLAVGGLAFAAVAAGIFLAGKVMGGSGSRGPSVVLRDRTQLTFTARIRAPAISPDGKQLAYITQDCRGGSCSYAIEVQDVGGTETRRLYAGATSLYGVTWAEDRRNLIVSGTIGGRYGAWLLSALGGNPRFLTSSGWAAFFAGGDSIVISPSAAVDTAIYAHVTGLDGVPRDSIRIAGPGTFALVQAVPGTRWFSAVVFGARGSLLRILDRAGAVTDELRLDAATGPPAMSADAFWIRLQRAQAGIEPIQRIPFDAARGRLSAQRDTVYSGQGAGYSVSADGRILVVEEGTFQHDVYALDARDAFRGSFAESSRLLRASTTARGSLSPDGRHIIVGREIGGAFQLALRSWEGGAETPLPTNGVSRWFWLDSVSIALQERVADAQQLSISDLRGRRREVFVVPESTVVDFTARRGGGWLWFSPDGRRVRARPGGSSVTLEWALPAWYISAFDISSLPDGRIAFIGWNEATFDSLRITVLDPRDSSMTPWATLFAETGYIRPLADGSLLFAVAENQDVWTLYRARGPGRLERIGRVPRPAINVHLSDDLRRIVVNTRESFGDAFLMRVVQP